MAHELGKFIAHKSIPSVRWDFINYISEQKGMILGAHELAKFMGHFTSPEKKMSTKLDAI